jgi:aspartate aminotransferase-like enzyme
MKKIRLFTPGPCAVPEEVLLEMARPFEHHRTPWFTGLMTRRRRTSSSRSCAPGMRSSIITGSGTAAAEGVIIGCNPPGSKLLTIEGGKFGQRWGEIAEQYGIDVIRHEIEWGTAIDPQVIADYLQEGPGNHVVMVVPTARPRPRRAATSKPSPRSPRRRQAAFVDCITSAGALPVKPDEWGVDVLITGAQKSLMIPPGLGFALDQRAGVERDREQQVTARLLPEPDQGLQEAPRPTTRPSRRHTC